MAHVGKQWKLQFRRDLARVASNQQAYPEAYLIAGIAGAGSIGSAMPTTPWLVINTETNNQPPMVWLSEVQIVNGVPVHVSIEIPDPYIISQSDIVLRVLKLGNVVIYKSTNQTNPLSGPSPGLWLTVGGTVDAQGSEFHTGSSPPALGGHAATWADYNP